MSKEYKDISSLYNSQTALQVKLKALSTNYGKDSDSRKTIIYLNGKLELISELWEKFNGNDELISKYADPSDPKNIEYLNVTYENVTNVRFELKTKILTKIDEITPEPPAPPIPVPPNNNPVADVQLAKISIPTFCGAYTTWKGFHDMFVALIHNNESLTDVQKLYHLMSNISGEASALVSHLEPTNENYAAAWEILRDRYENIRVLVFSQIKRLVSQPCTSSDSAVSIRKLHDTTKECLFALTSLKIDVKSWDPLLLYLLFQKLDQETYKMWELSFTKPKELPTIQVFLSFLQIRFQNLENIVCIKPRPTAPSFFNSKPIKSLAVKNDSNVSSNSFVTEENHSNANCVVCCGNHRIFRCRKFKSMSIVNRRELVKSKDLCFLCLKPDHEVECCTWSDGCRHCGQKHNALLHFNTEHANTNTNPTTDNEAERIGLVSNHAENTSMSGNVLLATALVKVKSKSGEFQVLRCLVDSGSQFSIITEAAAIALNIKRRAIIAPLSGIGGIDAGVSKTIVELTIQSQHSSFEMETEALVMRKVTNLTPYNVIRKSNWEHLTGLPLADPNYFKPGKIDLLLGSDVCPYIQKSGLVIKDRDTPVAQETEFGWLLSGRVNGNTHLSTGGRQVLHLHSDIDATLQKFWNQEETVQTERILSDEEVECENHFVQTHTRQENGRYVVRLPFRKANDLKLGKSRNQAIAVLLQMERKFLKDQTLDRYYKDFMREYENLGHMELIPKTQLYDNQYDDQGSYKVCYFPHHGVWKDTSKSTKLRVVFNGSSNTSTKVSLNQKLMVGPTIQNNLADIVLLWRTHLVAFTADIEKMYRQILIDQSDRDFQRIVWRENSTSPIQEYRLNTVTYGTSSAPFLAIRTLQQLALDEKENYPLASNVISTQMYVDDCLSGADDVKSALALQDELLKISRTAGMDFKKWASNCPELLENVAMNSREMNFPLNIEEDEFVKALGIHWHPLSDCFQFKVNLGETKAPMTKRIFLSEAARLFDPLGWLAPTIILAKISFQKLWLEKLKWDDTLSPQLNKHWTEFKAELPAIEEIQIPRWIGTTSNNCKVELHGFCDASIDAYAAVLYLRTINSRGIEVSMLTAKTRVAPISQISLPRLELCGAHLVAKLLTQTKDALKRSDIELFAWTDSMIVLSWLADHPNRWKTFVANRVSKIQKSLSFNQWRHVISADNPADVASRGIMPSQLKNHPLWWQGPSWLKEPTESWSISRQSVVIVTPPEEECERRIIHTVVKSDFVERFLNRHSKLHKLLIHTAWLRRFVSYVRDKKKVLKEPHISAQELFEARRIWYKISQRAVYATEILCLEQNKAINSKSSILSLDPRLDEEGILRVGGRLKNAHVAFDEKHPMLLPGKGVFVELLINEAHLKTLHGGTQQVLSHVRYNTWIINARNAIKKQIHQCMVCFRQGTKPGKQLMGDLPPERINISSAFSNSGVDYAGPITLKVLKGPRNRTYKGYIALFICMATKAVHIELVEDLTSEGFLSAFYRFTSRRGVPTNMYSDNGTNLVGANNILIDKARRAAFHHTIASVIAKDGTNWHFIPPGAPHMGGLWEAAIKSMKRHLKRCVGETVLDFVEMTTLLVKIEACLNSRPLCPLNDDVNDTNALTVGHLLIGKPLNASPHPDITEIPINRVRRWQLVERLTQDFWKRWQCEYLQKLQERPKWQQRTPEELRIGDLVLIQHENFPPTKWPMGRVLELHPGSDKLVRVVTLKTQQSILKRPITKLCRLPIYEDTSKNVPAVPTLKPTNAMLT